MFQQIFTILQQLVNSVVTIGATLAKSFPQVTGTATTATGGAQTLPANPAGFVTVLLPSGSTVKIPYYNT